MLRSVLAGARHRLLIAAAVSVLGVMAFAQAMHPVSGRRIAGVMGHAGAASLERPEQEQEEAPSKAIAALTIRPGQAIADIGAGSGYYTLRLADAVGPPGCVHATDIQPEMLALIKKKKSTRDQPGNVELVLGTETENAGLPAAAIDMALMVDVYHELAQPQAFLRSLKTALRPDGRLVLIEFRTGDASVPIRAERKNVGPRGEDRDRGGGLPIRPRD